MLLHMTTECVSNYLYAYKCMSMVSCHVINFFNNISKSKGKQENEMGKFKGEIET